jgi:hypothetical protein
MKKDSNYFAQAREYSNQKFLGADGWSSDGEWESAFGNELPADAAGMGADPVAQVASQPYIVTLTCGSVDVTDVEILNAALRQLNPAVAGVSFAYSIPGLTYTQFLAGLSTGKSFKVSQIRLSASNSSNSVAIQQVQETVSVTQKDLNGNTVGKPLIPSMDSYQYSQTIIDLFADFDVDGMTSMIISNLYANTALKIYLYPSARVNQFKQLMGEVPVSTYKNPLTNRVLGRKGALGLGSAK